MNTKHIRRKLISAGVLVLCVTLALMVHARVASAEQFRVVSVKEVAENVSPSRLAQSVK